MPEFQNYYEKVYAGLLGKVIGVYIGRPFEGWTNERIEKELGEITSYVNDRLKVPLVVSDDDISGTLTFIRALDDHMAWGKITSEQIGKTWLNYLTEYENILWWAGLGISTEHTAWLRLKAGIPAPLSGAIETNGRTVAEQIGAQIFIDSWAMVAPGDPDLAVELAGLAGRVSHDGAAVHAAQAVAAMESLAFIESNMTRLLDCALKHIPRDSIIYSIHQDVREWAAANGDDWRKTFSSIKEKYGYDKFGGGCHVVPNHAVMVMAWAHAPDSFSRAMLISGTAGWDTDCNMANVGCLMGIKDGLAGLRADGRDWQTPFADRLIIPTSKGTTDVLRETDMLVRMGRKVMGWKDAPEPKKGAKLHFLLPGALHGFMSSDSALATIENVAGETARCLKISLHGTAARKPADISTPVFLAPDMFPKMREGYPSVLPPTLYSGQKLTASISCGKESKSAVNVALFIRHYTAMGRDVTTAQLSSEPLELTPGAAGKIEWIVPATGGMPVFELGLSFTGKDGGTVYLDSVDWTGAPAVTFPSSVYRPGYAYPYGWSVSGRPDRHLRTRDTCTEITANTGLTLLATGTSDWQDYALSADVKVKISDASGIVARCGGLTRYLALEFRWKEKKIHIVRQYDENRRILASADCKWKLNEVHNMRLEVRGLQVTALADGRKILEARFRGLPAGGIGMFSETGATEFTNMKIEPLE